MQMLLLALPYGSDLLVGKNTTTVVGKTTILVSVLVGKTTIPVSILVGKSTLESDGSFLDAFVFVDASIFVEKSGRCTMTAT